MNERKRPTFTDEFKREAVRLTLTSERTIRQVADDLGIGFSTLTKWKRKFYEEDLLSGPHGRNRFQDNQIRTGLAHQFPISAASRNSHWPVHRWFLQSPPKTFRARLQITDSIRGRDGYNRVNVSPQKPGKSMEPRAMEPLLSKVIWDFYLLAVG